MRTLRYRYIARGRKGTKGPKRERVLTGIQEEGDTQGGTRSPNAPLRLLLQKALACGPSHERPHESNAPRNRARPPESPHTTLKLLGRPTPSTSKPGGTRCRTPCDDSPNASPRRPSEAKVQHCNAPKHTRLPHGQRHLQLLACCPSHTRSCGHTTWNVTPNAK